MRAWNFEIKFNCKILPTDFWLIQKWFGYYFPILYRYRQSVQMMSRGKATFLSAPKRANLSKHTRRLAIFIVLLLELAALTDQSPSAQVELEFKHISITVNAEMTSMQIICQILSEHSSRENYSYHWVQRLAILSKQNVRWKNRWRLQLP